MRKLITAIVLVIFTTGCATGRVNGIDTPTQDSSGGEVVGAILAIAALGAIGYAIGRAGGSLEDDYGKADAVYRTSHSGGGTTTTRVYRK